MPALILHGISMLPSPRTQTQAGRCLCLHVCIHIVQVFNREGIEDGIGGLSSTSNLFPRAAPGPRRSLLACCSLIHTAAAAAAAVWIRFPPMHNSSFHLPLVQEGSVVSNTHTHTHLGSNRNPP